MAYNKQQAHEYYENYTKKGKLKGRKGRKKGSKNKTEKVVGLYTAGMNDAGKMEVALLREEINTQLNEALKNITDPEKRKEIKRDFQYKALEKLKELKNNPSFLKEKKSNKEKTKKETSTSKSEKKAENSGNNATEKETKQNSNANEASNSVSTESTATKKETKSQETKQNQSTQASKKSVSDSKSEPKQNDPRNAVTQMLKSTGEVLNLLNVKKDNMTDEQKSAAQQLLNQIINFLVNMSKMDKGKLLATLQGIKDGNINSME